MHGSLMMGCVRNMKWPGIEDAQMASIVLYPRSERRIQGLGGRIPNFDHPAIKKKKSSFLAFVLICCHLKIKIFL